MSIVKHSVISVNNIEVRIERKDIKNLHIGIYPPLGKVRVAAPLHIDNEAVRLAIISRLPWIKKQKSSFENQPRQTKREMISGESHYFLGKRYLLDVINSNSKHQVIKQHSKLELYVGANTSVENRQKVLNEWYREELKKEVSKLIPKCEKLVGVKCNKWGVKQMKTKWGTCNIADKRILLNLELAKKPPICLEYIIVHELVHLFERNHNSTFITLMDKFMPKWRIYREELNSLPISHNE